MLHETCTNLQKSCKNVQNLEAPPQNTPRENRRGITLTSFAFACVTSYVTSSDHSTKPPRTRQDVIGCSSNILC